MAQVPTPIGTTTVQTQADIDAAEASAKAYADTLVVGLLDDRGNYDASGNTYPATGGSGTAGAILKGDVWTVSVAGVLNSVPVQVGDFVRALIDTPGQTAANWAVTEGNFGYTPARLTPPVASVSSSSGVVTIDLSSATQLYTLALTENVTSWVFNNPPAANTFRDIEVQITQHASSAKTVVSPATSGKTAGGAWTVSSTASAVEVLGIRVFSDGTKHLFPSGVFA